MNHRILFVDEKTELLEKYRRYFTRFGFEVDGATDSETAVSMIVKNRYAAVVCELTLNHLPDDREGLELARATRVLRPATAFLLLTTHVDEAIEQDSRSAGVFSCLPKPKSLSVIKNEILFAVDPIRLARVKTA